MEQEDISSVTEIYWGHSGRREKTFMDVVTMGVRLPLKVYSVVRCLRIKRVHFHLAIEERLTKMPHASSTIISIMIVAT